MSLAAAAPLHPQRPTALGVLLDVLQRTGWKRTGTSDPYLVGADAMQLEPIRAKGATGHTPARVVSLAGVVSLSTYTWHGELLDCCSWSMVTPHNIERVLDYMHHAAEEAVAV